MQKQSVVQECSVKKHVLKNLAITYRKALELVLILQNL